MEDRERGSEAETKNRRRLMGKIDREEGKDKERQ